MGIKEFMDACGIPPKLPTIANTYQGKRLVICGDARNIWDDLETFGCRLNEGRGKVGRDGWDFLTVNKMVEVFPGDVEHCYSNSSACLVRFIAARRDEYAREFKVPKHSHAIMEGVQWEWPFGGHGTSGLGACLVGLALGYEQIVICGMPLDDGPHNGEPPWRTTAFASSEAAGSEKTGRNVHWMKAKNLAFDGRVTSMSGRTREWLGGP